MPPIHPAFELSHDLCIPRHPKDPFRLRTPEMEDSLGQKRQDDRHIKRAARAGHSSLFCLTEIMARIPRRTRECSGLTLHDGV